MKRLLLLALLPLLLLAACHTVPDHVKYIPKNAVGVMGVDLKSLGRKVAWSKITGSPLLDEMERSMKEAGGTGSLKDLQESGLKMNTTLYAFFSVNSDPAAAATQSAGTVVLPLDDAGKWEAYIKKTYATVQIVSGAGGKKEAQLGSNLFAAWNDEVAFLQTPFYTAGSYRMLPDSTEEWQAGTADAAATLASLRTRFDLKKDLSVAEDKRFTALQKEGDDANLWINYDALMAQNGSMGMLGGMSATLWKDAAVAMGINFEDGRAAMDMKYYTPEALKDAYTEMGKGSAPSAMMEKLSGQNLAVLGAFNLSPKGLRMLLEKMGMLGIANMSLAAQGLSIDDVLEAFSGDIAFSMNNLRMTSSAAIDTTEDYRPAPGPDADYIVALGVGKKEKMNKLVSFATGRRLLRQVAPNTYTGITGNSGVLLVDGGYAVVAKDATAARAYIDGKWKNSLPAEAKKGSGPTLLYADIRNLLTGMESGMNTNTSNIMVIQDAKARFSTMRFTGGNFSNGAITGNGELLFTNKNENALLQLLDFASKIQTVRKSPTATAAY